MQIFDLFSKRQESCDTELIELLKSLRQAQKDYAVALSCFEEVTEVDKIDETIFLMAAARKKYSYYLRKLRAYTWKNHETMCR